jgi:phage shock protein A
MTQHPQGIFGRFRSLVRAIFAGWIRDGERQHPRAVYEQAIDDRKRQYRELKEAVAGILYMRNKLEAEIGERRAEIARLHDDVRRAVRRGEDEVSLALIRHKQQLLEELERSEQELEALRREAEESKANLLRFRDEIRDLVREKGHALAALASAQTRRRMQEALEGLSVEAEMKALESVREHVARLSTLGALDRELGGDEGLRRRLRAVRDGARDEAAREELAELKRGLAARVLPAASAPGEVLAGEERALPTRAS